MLCAKVVDVKIAPKFIRNALLCECHAWRAHWWSMSLQMACGEERRSYHWSRSQMAPCVCAKNSELSTFFAWKNAPLCYKFKNKPSDCLTTFPTTRALICHVMFQFCAVPDGIYGEGCTYTPNIWFSGNYRFYKCIFCDQKLLNASLIWHICLLVLRLLISCLYVSEFDVPFCMCSLLFVCMFLWLVV